MTDKCERCAGTGDVPPRTNPGENAPESPQPVECQQVDIARRGEVVPHYQWTNGEVAALRAEVERQKNINLSLVAHLDSVLSEVNRLKQIITNMEEDL